MAARQIHHMDIIADTRTVRRIVIVSEYIELFAFAHRDLRDVRHQVVWFTIRIFPDPAAYMCADRIEIAQHDDRPSRVRMVKIGEHLLYHKFRPAIWTRGIADWGLLRKAFTLR